MSKAITPRSLALSRPDWRRLKGVDRYFEGAEPQGGTSKPVANMALGIFGTPKKLKKIF